MTALRDPMGTAPLAYDGPAWSPYLLGALIGVLTMLTFYVSGKPLGASTAYARLAGMVGRVVAPRRTDAQGSGSGGVSIEQLVKGGLFGVIFGFLLQKGGVAQYHILVGALLLEDFTVMKVMLTAIIVGGAGSFGLHALGVVELRIKPTRYASNSVGGLLGYCSGAGAAALGQGNWDVIGGIVGLMAGSYLFAEFSGTLNRTINTWGALGRLTLPELFGMKRTTSLMIWLPALTLALVAMHRFTVR